MTLTLLALQSHLGDKPIKFQVLLSPKRDCGVAEQPRRALLRLFAVPSRWASGGLPGGPGETVFFPNICVDTRLKIAWQCFLKIFYTFLNPFRTAVPFWRANHSKVQVMIVCPQNGTAVCPKRGRKRLPDARNGGCVSYRKCFALRRMN